jgi:hypothetical protein
MAKRQEPQKFQTQDLTLVAFLLLVDISPIDWTERDGRGTLYYDQDADLESAIVEYNSICPSCGITFSKLPMVLTEARKMLFDGKLKRPK